MVAPIPSWASLSEALSEDEDEDKSLVVACDAAEGLLEDFAHGLLGSETIEILNPSSPRVFWGLKRAQQWAADCLTRAAIQLGVEGQPLIQCRRDFVEERLTWAALTQVLREQSRLQSPGMDAAESWLKGALECEGAGDAAWYSLRALNSRYGCPWGPSALALMPKAFPEGYWQIERLLRILVTEDLRSLPAVPQGELGGPLNPAEP